MAATKDGSVMPLTAVRVVVVVLMGAVAIGAVAGSAVAPVPLAAPASLFAENESCPAEPADSGRRHSSSTPAFSGLGRFTFDGLASPAEQQYLACAQGNAAQVGWRRTSLTLRPRGTLAGA